MWREYLVPFLEENGYDCCLVGGGNKIPPSLKDLGRFYYQAEQYKNLSDKIIMGEIKNGDIFVFEDSFNIFLLPLRYLIENSGLDLRIVSLFYDSSIWQNSIIRRNLKISYKKLAFNFEKISQYCSNHVAFFSESELMKYKRFISHKTSKIEVKGMSIIGYPTGDLYNKITSRNYTKEPNSVFIYSGTWPDGKEEIGSAIEKMDPSHKYYYFSGYPDRKNYLDMLKKSEFVLFLDDDPTMVINIYESMVYGCIPLIPDTGKFREYFPNEFIFRGKTIKLPFLNLVRGLDEILEKMNFLSTNRHYVQEATLELEKNYFSNKRFLDLLDNIIKGNYD